MTLRKITVDNSVKYIPQNEQTKQKDIKASTIKNNSIPKKQKKHFQQNNKNVVKNYIAGEGFGTLK